LKTKFQKDFFSNKKRNEKKGKKFSGSFFGIFPNQIFCQKIFINFLYPFKTENKHIEVENHFFFQVTEIMSCVPMVLPSIWPVQFDIFPSQKHHQKTLEPPRSTYS